MPGALSNPRINTLYALDQTQTAKESDYAIHQQQFNYYGTLSYFDRLDALAELSYGLARIVELVADTQDTPKRRDFFARLEAILGKPVTLPTQQAA